MRHWLQMRWVDASAVWARWAADTITRHVAEVVEDQSLGDRAHERFVRDAVSGSPGLLSLVVCEAHAPISGDVLSQPDPAARVRVN